MSEQLPGDWLHRDCPSPLQRSKQKVLFLRERVIERVDVREEGVEDGERIEIVGICGDVGGNEGEQLEEELLPVLHQLDHRTYAVQKPSTPILHQL